MFCVLHIVNKVDPPYLRVQHITISRSADALGTDDPLSKCIKKLKKNYIKIPFPILMLQNCVEFSKIVSNLKIVQNFQGYRGFWEHRKLLVAPKFVVLES